MTQVGASILVGHLSGNLVVEDVKFGAHRGGRTPLLRKCPGRFPHAARLGFGD